ncbi:MAG: hypothetical protein ACM37W_14510 [Actinomycetota bacterium]
MKLSVSTVQSFGNLLTGIAAAATAIASPTILWVPQTQALITHRLAVSPAQPSLSWTQLSSGKADILPLLQNSSCPNQEPRDCPPHGTR